MFLEQENGQKLTKKCIFQQFFLSQTKQLTISDIFCIIRTRKNEVQVQSFSIVSSQSTKIDQNVNFWPVLTNFNPFLCFSSTLHSIENEILGMHTLLEMVYATFFDISDIKGNEIEKKLRDFCQIEPKIKKSAP